MENIFEIKNKFIPTKDQQAISQKFDPYSVDRTGKNMDILGTQKDLDQGGLMPVEDLAVSEAPVLGQVPDFTPRKEFDQYNNNLT